MKKYRTMSQRQCGLSVKKVLGRSAGLIADLLLLAGPALALEGGPLLRAAAAEAEEPGQADERGAQHGPQRSRGQVAGRQLRIGRQTVHLGPVDEEEEGVQTAERPLLVGAVEVGPALAPGVELRDPRRRAL